ncbi:MAG: hypothetical protein KVP17_002483 [Porospora cf. gigantea B]|uniref:uncharacterized protein n=1 Tax=Porospora cf. gigantea B TaxID=2853592 RepID=UPI003571C760|nr:MAG: hypothetical protein KVP17_002483 [Porospora cf. gigantea B]
MPTQPTLPAILAPRTAPQAALPLPAYVTDSLLRKTCASATSHGQPQALISSGASPTDVLLLVLQQLGKCERIPEGSYVDLPQTEITKTGVNLHWKQFQFNSNDCCHLPDEGLSPEDGDVSCSNPRFEPALPAQYWYAAAQFLKNCLDVADPVGVLDAELNTSGLSGGGRMRHLGIRNAYRKLNCTGTADNEAVARALDSMTCDLPVKDVEDLRPLLTACFNLRPKIREESVNLVLRARQLETSNASVDTSHMKSAPA